MRLSGCSSKSLASDAEARMQIATAERSMPAAPPPRSDLRGLSTEDLMVEFAKKFAADLKTRWNSTDGAIAQLDKTFEEQVTAHRKQLKDLTNLVYSIKRDR
jgi:hypothetical protein